MVIQGHPDTGQKCIDVPFSQFVAGKTLQIYDCNNTNAQTFDYDQTSQRLGIGNLCVQIPGNAGDAVGLADCNGAVTQRWGMIGSGDYYQIVGIDNRCLGVKAGANGNGAQLDTPTCQQGNARQLWALIQAPSAAAATPLPQQQPQPAIAGSPPPQAGVVTPVPPPPSAATSGGCKTDNFTFSAVLSQSATTNSVSIGGATCFYSVAPIHPDQVEFTSASIVEQPNNGTFEQTENFAFKYQPKPGFKGTDEYAIKVCGHNSQRAGCATVTYRVTVK